MEPLRANFPRLEEDELYKFVNILTKGDNPDACAICNKPESNCSKCYRQSKSIRDVVIESHIPLVLGIAGRLGGGKKPEAISIGLLALTKAVDGMPKDIVNLGGFVRTWVAGDIKKFLLADAVVPVPFFGMQDHGHLRLTAPLADYTGVEGDQCLVDLYEVLEAIPQNENEETIMRCLEEGGYSLQDMSDMCDLGRPRVSQIKHSLLDRIQTAIGEV